MTGREERILFPELKRYSDFPLYNTKAVVQQTGIPAPTLRAWERRYTFLSPGRADNSYRRYSERDIAVIRWLKERVDSGMSISQAIALFRHLDEERRETALQQEVFLQEEDSTAFQVAFPTSPVNAQTQLGTESSAEEKVQAPGEILSSQGISSNVDIEKKQDTLPAFHDIRSTKMRLLEAFKVLDESTAENLVASMLASYPVEQVCAKLIAPTLWDIGLLWEQGKISVSVEHFASAFFRGILTNLFHVTPDVGTGPLVIVCCAPGEAHELAPLMLALLLRGAGLHVVYLGQSIEVSGLLDTLSELTTTLLCVSLTLQNYLDALIELAHKVQELPSPHTLFAFGGHAFEDHNEFIARVPGIYLDGDIISIVDQLRSLVAESASRS
jgi:MerR family transcriptional regulator, light-induced transcriptional regulator